MVSQLELSDYLHHDFRMLAEGEHTLSFYFPGGGPQNALITVNFLQANDGVQWVWLYSDLGDVANLERDFLLNLARKAHLDPRFGLTVGDLVPGMERAFFTSKLRLQSTDLRVFQNTLAAVAGQALEFGSVVYSVD